MWQASGEGCVWRVRPARRGKGPGKMPLAASTPGPRAVCSGCRVSAGLMCCVLCVSLLLPLPPQPSGGASRPRLRRGPLPWTGACPQLSGCGRSCPRVRLGENSSLPLGDRRRAVCQRALHLETPALACVPLSSELPSSGTNIFPPSGPPAHAWCTLDQLFSNCLLWNPKLLRSYQERG